MGTLINMSEIKNRLEAAHNPNITKDNLTMNDSLVYDHESVIEKPGEIIICEEITEDTFSRVESKFVNAEENKENANNKNRDLETGVDNNQIRIKHKDFNEKENNDNKEITVVKIYDSKLDDIYTFINIMHFLSEKK